MSGLPDYSNEVASQLNDLDGLHGDDVVVQLTADVGASRNRRSQEENLLLLLQLPMMHRRTSDDGGQARG